MCFLLYAFSAGAVKMNEQQTLSGAVTRGGQKQIKNMHVYQRTFLHSLGLGLLNPVHKLCE